MNIFQIVTATALLLSTLLAGCVGMYVNANAPSAGSGETYAQVSPKLTPPVPPNGRIFVYRTADSSATEFRALVGFVGKFIPCKINTERYSLYWEMFAHREFSSGKYVIACGEYSGREVVWTAKSLEFDLATGESAYIRIDVVDGKPTPVRVEAAKSQAEMSNLKIWSEFRPSGKAQ